MSAVAPVKIARWEPSQLDGKSIAFRFTKGESQEARRLKFGLISALGTKEEAIVMISPAADDEESPNYFLTLAQDAVDQIEIAPLRLGCSYVCAI